MESLRADIEERLAESEPEVELIAVEQPDGQTLRLFIDHPQGVDLARCEEVTNLLRDLLSSYSLEVSSPGLDRPLTKPEHFSRFVGSRVRVRTRQAIDGRRKFTGTLAEADGRSLHIELSDGAVDIPVSEVQRSNLVPDLPEVHG